MPPAGWYPDPEYAGHVRWWSGHEWTVRQPVPPPGGGASWVPRSLGRGFGRLAAVIGVLLALTTMLFVAQFGLAAWGVSMVDDAVATGDVDRLDTYDGVDLVLGVLVAVGLLATGVLWMVWQYRLASSLRPGELDRGPGMHAWSWVIPVVAAWFPYQNVKQLWALLTPRSRGILRWWWAAWIVGTVLDRIVLASYDSADTVGDVKAYMVLEGVTAAVGLVTAVLAIRIIRTLTAGGFVRAAGSQVGQVGPVGPVSPGGSPAVW